MLLIVAVPELVRVLPADPPTATCVIPVAEDEALPPTEVAVLLTLIVPLFVRVLVALPVPPARTVVVVDVAAGRGLHITLPVPSIPLT